MPKLTITDLLNEIDALGMERIYDYFSGLSKLQITRIQKPEGPISFNRWNNQLESGIGSISTAQLARIATICSNKPNYPLHVDRLFSAGGNSRSALETLLAYTPHFFMCFPVRFDSYTGEMLQNLKHIMWCPDKQHPLGEIGISEYNETITELELGLDFGQIGITSEMLSDDLDSIEAKTTHTQMQIALVEIGNALNFRTWIAANDRHIPVRDTTLGRLPGVIQSLEDVDILYKSQAKQAASLLDCIWFTKDFSRIPAVMEIEHSTGVTSGLTRMHKLQSVIPAVSINFTVVAPNHLRNKVVKEANQTIFRELRTRFMPYSTIRELYGLIQRYHLTNVVDHTFIEPFMEAISHD